MLTNVFTSMGLTRDDAVWGWAQIVAFAGIILGAGYDGKFVIDGLAYLGINVGVTFAHWVVAGCAVVLWVSGRFDSSTLPGKK